MVRATAKKSPEKILSVTEQAGLKEEKRDLEISLKEAEGYGEGTPGAQLDKGLIKRQINRIDQAIHDSQPGRLTPMQRDALAKEAKELEEQFKIGLPTKYEMDHPAKCPQAVRKHQKWTLQNKALAVRYRNIQRLINPGEERSIEELRKEK